MKKKIIIKKKKPPTALPQKRKRIQMLIALHRLAHLSGGGLKLAGEGNTIYY